MYKGFQSKRHFHNAKLHGLSIIICGDRSLLDEEIYNILKSRPQPPLVVSISTKSDTHVEKSLRAKITTTDLTDREAESLYFKLCRVASKVKKNQKAVDKILKTGDDITDRQRKAIVRICKYKLHWTPQGTFHFVLGCVPKYRKRLTPYEIQNSELSRLYSLIKRSEANTIIKKLDKLQERNKHMKGVA